MNTAIQRCVLLFLPGRHCPGRQDKCGQTNYHRLAGRNYLRTLARLLWLKKHISSRQQSVWPLRLKNRDEPLSIVTGCAYLKETRRRLTLWDINPIADF